MERLGHLIEETVAEGVRKPLYLSRRRPPLSHLFFADDLMLFYEASVTQENVVSSILDIFCYFSRKIFNVSKSHVFSSSTTPIDVSAQIGTRLGFSIVSNLGFYLGIPLSHDRVTMTTFDFLVNKVR